MKAVSLVRSEAWPLGEALEFLRALWAVDHELQRTSRRMASSLGVTGPQRLVLRVVGRFPGILPGQLAEILHLHPSTLTSLLKRLEQQSLITRRSDPRDRRRRRLGLTAKGLELVDRGATPEAAVRRLMAELPDATIRSTVEALSRLAELLDETK